MSETTNTDTPAPSEPQYGEPHAASDTTSPHPNTLDGGDREPIDAGVKTKDEAKPADKPKPEDDKTATPKVKEDWREVRLRQQNARIASEAQRADKAERENAELRAAARPPGEAEQPKAQPPQDFEAAVLARATELAEQQAFAKECTTVADAGQKEFGADFDPTIKTLWDATEGLDRQGNLTPRAIAVIEAALETDKPHAVLHYLGQNPDEAIRIAGMRSDAKRGAAIARVANTLSVAAATPKPISRAPAPLEPVNGSARSEVGSQGPKDMAAWIKWREQK